MIYALNLAEDKRCLSATYAKYASPDMVLVDHLPEGDLYDYKYIDGEYVFEPIEEAKTVAKKGGKK